MSIIYVPAGDQDRETAWDLSDLPGDSDLGILSEVFCEYGRLGEEYSVLNASVVLWFADLRPLVIRSSETKSRASMMKVGVGALKLTFWSRITGIPELEN